MHCGRLQAHLAPASATGAFNPLLRVLGVLGRLGLPLSIAPLFEWLQVRLFGHGMARLGELSLMTHPRGSPASKSGWLV